MERLSDEQYLRFLVDGFVVIQPATLTETDHDYLYERARDLYGEARESASTTTHLDILGDHLLDQIPELRPLLDDPAVDGALTGILGADYLLHPHSFLHESVPGDQPFHQDGNLPWNERGHYRSHRPDWALIFYYPQAVDEDNGPTEIVPGTQYWTQDFETADRWHAGDRIGRELDLGVLGAPDLEARDALLKQSLATLGIPGLERQFLHVPKGSVVVASYDLMHRGSRTIEDADDRFMFKFYFARTREPAATEVASLPNLEAVRPEIQPIVRQIWGWSRGTDPDGMAPSVESGEHAGMTLAHDLEAKLLVGREDQKVEASYLLGEMATSDRAAVEVLRRALHDDAESTRRASMYGLRTAGAAAIEVLRDALQAERPSTRRLATAGLGSVAAALDSTAVESLLVAMEEDPDDLVRSNAAYSLGQVVRFDALDPAPVERIAQRLTARLGPDVELDNAFNASLTRSTVRQSVAYALVQLGANHLFTAPQRADLTKICESDDDRYVRGLIAASL
ncbi:MAG: phytanoyl-CoA dioxygenase family protein [Acidimicrobiales bacterium]|jgi:hypothetical protein